LIDTVATDHAPFDFATQKARGRDDFTQIPNGIPALEERIKLLHTYGVGAGRIDLPTLVNAASTRVAQIFDLYPAKARFSPGPTPISSSSIRNRAAQSRRRRTG